MNSSGWVKLGNGEGYTFPETPYEAVVKHALETIAAASATFPKEYGVPYIPTLSTAWDSSPRTLPHDGWGDWGYPWGISWHSNMSEWSDAISRSKQAIDTRCSAGMRATKGHWCPPVIINAWNEWSEGAYLEPDVRYGYGRLEALKAVYGQYVRRPEA